MNGEETTQLENQIESSSGCFLIFHCSGIDARQFPRALIVWTTSFFEKIIKLKIKLNLNIESNK